MKVFIYILVLSISTGCIKITYEKPEFPDCVGIEGSFNPQNITKPYSGKIWSTDTTIYTQFVFTDYKNYNVIIGAEKSWTMWIKLTAGTSTIYQSCQCNYLFNEKAWYAFTGMDFNNEYSTWEFYFDTFECSNFSGTCVVNQPEIGTTVHYQFEGAR